MCDVTVVVLTVYGLGERSECKSLRRVLYWGTGEYEKCITFCLKMTNQVVDSVNSKGLQKLLTTFGSV